jgi:hypothetical protein
MTLDKTYPPEKVKNSPFHLVAENLYRRESSGVYYALLKRADKQFRRSLKTSDRKLAVRRLAKLKLEIGGLRPDQDARVNYHIDFEFAT